MTQFKYRAILVLSGAAFLFSACGTESKDATEANFETALNAHFSKMKECIKVGKEPDENGIIGSFRVDGKGFGAGNRDFLDALASAGLLTTTSFTKEEIAFTTKRSEPVAYIGFKLSSEGDKYLRPDELDKGFFRTGMPQLCYGTPQVVNITNFTEPADAMGVMASNVQFTYEVIDVAPWATNSALVKQFKWLPDRLANQAIKGDEDMVLTNNGWVHHSVLKN